MVTSPGKRPASASPDSQRAHKRQATSSPEEGELDDHTPPQAHPSLPPKPQTTVNAKPTKVPFPFKKKEQPSKNGSTSGADSNDPEGRSMRDAESRKRPARGSGRPAIDRWEPSSSRHYAPLPARWDTYAPRDYRDRERDRERARSPPAPAPRSSYSPPRSRSPSSGSPGQREKHRLPAHRTPPPDSNFSPPRSRDRDRDRSRDTRDRDRYSDRDERERDRDRRYRDEDSRHYHPEDSDRRYRPDRDAYSYRRDDDRRGGGRAYDYDYGRSYRYDERERERGRRMGSYRPLSPSRYTGTPPPRSPSSQPAPPPPAAVSQALRSPSSHPPIQTSEHDRPTPGTPPPPAQSPPPAPPPDARLLPKTDMLPDIHGHVAIPMKRPGAPKDFHSPPSILPHQPREADKEKEQEKEKEKAEIKARLARTMQVTRRSRKEEMEAYGRTFAGCGEQSDYEVTTKLGEGTFGEVHKAIHKITRKVVALKRILMHNEKEGMPVTALREIKILKALNHSCIVDIVDMFVVRSNDKDPLSVYMVFPYMDHDLAGLLENERVKLQPSHIKLYMKQLLEGTEYMHRNHILHRDMKAANLLISNNGSLKIADFGLARSYDPNVSRAGLDARGRERRYTNCVVTRWYRPPELLLGARHYGGEVDMWGIGCVLGEMFSRRPILPGTSDLDQLEKIWQLCGTPNQHTWPNYDALPGCEGVKRFPQHSRKVKPTYEAVGPETCDLLDKLLVCNPRERITAAEALHHEYFWTDPMPADPKTLPSYEASHEFDKRGHRNQHPAHGVVPPHHFPPTHGHHIRDHPHPPPPHQPPYRPPGPPGQGGPPYHHQPPPGRPAPPHGYHGPPPPPPYGGGRGTRRPPLVPGAPGGPPALGPGPGHPLGPSSLPRPPPHLPAKPKAPMGREREARERDAREGRDNRRDGRDGKEGRDGRERDREARISKDGRERDGKWLDRNGHAAAEDTGGELNYG